MSVSQEQNLLIAMQEQTAALKAQTEALSRLADSNFKLCELIVQSFDEESDEPLEIMKYLDGRTVR